MTLYTIGSSVEGRPIKVVKLSTGGGGKKAIFIGKLLLCLQSPDSLCPDGGIHAREWISPSTVSGILRNLVDNTARFSSILRKLDIYILPLLNPDGYEYSRTTDRLWRKNRSHPERGKCAGVDLNRNFSYRWGGRGSSRKTCSEEYRGERALSEPESAALARFMSKRKNTIDMYLTVHSYGQMILYPWGYDAKAVARDKGELHSMAQVGARAMSAKYKIGHSAAVTYETSGSSDDWAKAVAGVKYSYTVELPDTGKYHFILPESKIPGTVRDAVRAFKAMAEELIRRTAVRSSS